MTEPDDNAPASPKRTYKWPWFVLAAVILFIALAVLWVALKARQIEQERNVNAPLPSQSN